MGLTSYISSMDTSIMLFVFGSLLTIIGFLIRSSISNMADKIDELKDYIKDHDRKLDEAEEKRRDLAEDISEKIHGIITDHINPLTLRVQRLEDRTEGE